MRIIRTSELADLLTLDIDGSGARAAASFRDSYFHVVVGRDEPSARNLLERHFESHPWDDPVRFAEMMAGNVILGVYADSDGTLIGDRGGYDSTHLFSPPLATPMNRTIEKSGLFTISSAAHIKRALTLLNKARDQVPLERVLFFAENGYAAIIPVEAGSGYGFEIYKAVMPDFVKRLNEEMTKALDALCRVSLDCGLFMFVNHDKEAKVTLELMSNGAKVNQKITSKLVVPWLIKELGLPASAVGRAPAGQTSVEIPPLTYMFIPTGNSLEIDHSYLTSKRGVNNILNDLIRLLWLRAFGNTELPDGNRVFIGFGDSPRGSDAGLLDPLRGNVGFKVHDRSRELRPGERLMDSVIGDADPPFVTLPVFSDDGTVQFGNGMAVAESLKRVFFTGTVFRVKDVEEMREGLRTVLKEARYVPAPTEKMQEDGEMYTRPDYLARRRDSDELMNRFLISDTPDAKVDDKISAIASKLEI